MVEQGEVDALVAERVWAETEKALGEPHPERYFEVLRGCGALKKVFPEIDNLYGVPQPEKHHAEIDTGVHVMMVLQQACQLSNDKAVRFAALSHDLGKAATPQSILPSHHGHEERGAQLVKELCDRIKIPNHYRDLAVITACYHTHCHRAQELRPGTILKTLEGLDAFRRPQRFEQFLIACTADARGRKGHNNDPYPQAELLRQSWQACQSIDNRILIEQGFTGKEFAEALTRERIQKIAAIKASFQFE
jgi:tRNA nucleotidyltransferase (CCA-adding enzyme)